MPSETTIEQVGFAPGQPVARQIEIQNVGPIERLTLPIPEEGGVVVLRGPNGAGKDHALQAVHSLLAGEGKVPCRDRQFQGTVEGLGAKLIVRKSTRRTGELEAVHLEDRLDIADLVDPGIDDPEKADARRIKALVTLQSAKADPALFYGLVGGKAAFDALVSPHALKTDDLVEMAARIKRDIDAAARNEEGQAENAAGRAKSCHDAAEGVDLTAPDDEAALQAAARSAIQTEAALVQQALAAKEIKGRADQARVLFQSRKASYDGPSAVDAADTLQLAQARLSEAIGIFAAAQREAQDARTALDTAKAATLGAEQHEQTLAGWQKSIDDAAAVEQIDAEALQAASLQAKQAEEAIARGALIRRAKQSLADAAQHETAAKDHAKAAQTLRDAAKSTDTVLAAAIGPGPLRPEQGRLVLDTDRGVEPYGELSHGEKWKIAIEKAAETVGRGGIIVVPQTAWEGLSPANRRAVAEQARTLKVVVLTAEASDGELEAGVE